MEINRIFCVLGWEERFLTGMQSIWSKTRIKEIVLLIFEDYFIMHGMSSNLKHIEDEAKKQNIKLTTLKLCYSDSVANWKVLDGYFKNITLEGKTAINTTTFPRETIWTLLFFLKQQSVGVYYFYFKPKSYGTDWLTKNHKRPRLLFKHSGLIDLELPLALFVVTGFDNTRLGTLIDFFEPSKVILFCQSGIQYNNLERNQGFRELNAGSIEKVELDNYNITSSTDIISLTIRNHANYNIILSSQGPKTSAISTYKSYLESGDRVGLAYVPAIDFNQNYSSGILIDSVSGYLDFQNPNVQ